jgi:RNA recognition motif-containing protein
MNIFIGNLSHQTQVDGLRRAFESHGQVTTASIIKDKISGESKGFGFVEMPVQTEAEAAISGLNGTQLDGRALTVNVAKPRTDNRDRGNGSRY